MHASESWVDCAFAPLATIDSFRVRVFCCMIGMHNVGKQHGERSTGADVWQRVEQLGTLDF
eukprot:98297-Lingulodinium_polyedra.AAC.1